MAVGTTTKRSRPGSRGLPDSASLGAARGSAARKTVARDATAGAISRTGAMLQDIRIRGEELSAGITELLHRLT